MNIKIIDSKLSNINSIKNMIEWIGYEATIIENLRNIKDGDRIILPGIGNFGEAMSYLQKNNIGCGVHYKSINKYKFYKNKIINRKKNLIADKIGETILSIPIYESLRKNEIKFIVDKFKKFFE